MINIDRLVFHFRNDYYDSFNVYVVLDALFYNITALLLDHVTKNINFEFKNGLSPYDTYFQICRSGETSWSNPGSILFNLSS